jgi:hypothetical protein
MKSPVWVSETAQTASADGRQSTTERMGNIVPGKDVRGGRGRGPWAGRKLPRFFLTGRASAHWQRGTWSIIPPRIEFAKGAPIVRAPRVPLRAA